MATESILLSLFLPNLCHCDRLMNDLLNLYTLITKDIFRFPVFQILNNVYKESVIRLFKHYLGYSIITLYNL